MAPKALQMQSATAVSAVAHTSYRPEPTHELAGLLLFFLLFLLLFVFSAAARGLHDFAL